jgi:hypothetical protein
MAGNFSRVWQRNVYNILCNNASERTGWGMGAAAVDGSAARPLFYERREITDGPLGCVSMGLGRLAAAPRGRASIEVGKFLAPTL